MIRVQRDLAAMACGLAFVFRTSRRVLSWVATRLAWTCERAGLVWHEIAGRLEP